MEVYRVPISGVRQFYPSSFSPVQPTSTDLLHNRCPGLNSFLRQFIRISNHLDLYPYLIPKSPTWKEIDVFSEYLKPRGKLRLVRVKRYNYPMTLVHQIDHRSFETDIETQRK